MKTEKINNWIQDFNNPIPKAQLSILDAAAKAFTIYGYSSASIDLISDQIGVSKGSVYYYHRSKADLFLAVHKRAMTINLKEQIPIINNKKNNYKKLYDMSFAHAMLMMQHFYYQRVTVQGVDLYQSISTTPAEREKLAEVIDMRDTYEDLFLFVLKEGIKSNEFKKTNSQLAVKGILGALNWITVWYKPNEKEKKSDRKKIALQFAEQVTQGVLNL